MQSTGLELHLLKLDWSLQCLRPAPGTTMPLRRSSTRGGSSLTCVRAEGVARLACMKLLEFSACRLLSGTMPTRRNSSSKLMWQVLLVVLNLTRLPEHSTETSSLAMRGAAEAKLEGMLEIRIEDLELLLCCALRLALKPCLRMGLVEGSGLGHRTSRTHELGLRLAQAVPKLGPAFLRRNLHKGVS